MDAKGCAENSKALRAKIANMKPLYMRRRRAGGQEESTLSFCRLSTVMVFWEDETFCHRDCWGEESDIKVPLGMC